MTHRLGERRSARYCDGFTYIGVLFVVALAGISLAGLGEVWSTAAKRENEAQLLFVGGEMRRAIGQFFESSPGGAKRYPMKLEELLADPRYPTTRRYLRRLYVDPMTGAADWGLIRGPGNSIIGVYSRSEERPLKVAGFGSEGAAFANAARYADWRFVHEGASSGRAGGSTASPASASSSASDSAAASSPLTPFSSPGSSGSSGSSSPFTPLTPSTPSAPGSMRSAPAGAAR
jgi:type II secretory pathway pseudopilin PulG